MNSIFQLFKNTLIYFLGNISIKLISIIMLPMYTKYIAPADYGYYDIVLTYVSIVTAVVFLNINIGCLRFLIDAKTPADKDKIFSNVLSLFIFCSLLFTLLYVLFLQFISVKYPVYIYLYILTEALAGIYLSASRGLNKNLIFVVSGVISAIINAVISYILLIFGWDFSALFVSMIIAGLFKISILEYSIRFISSGKWIFSQMIIKNLLIFSVPLIFNSVSYWLCSGYSKIVILKFLGETYNGYYAIAGKCSLVIVLLSSCFSLAWQEMSYRKTSEGDNSQFFSKAFESYLKIAFSAYIVILPLIYILFPFFINSAYYEAINFIALYMLWILFDMITNFLGNIITGFKRTKVVFFSTLAGGIASVISLYILTPILGITGANMALIVGFAITWIWREVYLKKTIKLSVDWKKIVFIIPFVILSASNLLPHNYIVLLIMFIIAVLYVRKEIYKTYTSIYNKIAIIRSK